MKEHMAPLIEVWYKDWFRNEQLYNDWARKRGLCYNELFAIHVLDSTGGCTPSHIAQFLAIAKQTVNSVLSRLEKKGLIERIPSKEDKRSCLVVLNEQGRQLAQEVLAELKEIEYRVFSSFTEEEMQTMIDLNKRLTDRFSAEMKEGCST